jgi:NAD(P) transhydrogenase subunit alpha
MAATIGALKESAPGETRVSLVPEVASKFAAMGARVLIERGAGVTAQFPDVLFKSVEWADAAATVLAQANVLLTVQPLSIEQIDALKPGAVVIGYMQAYVTIRPAQVLIVGVGVAGLQAIATARRLGAIVEAYDVRSATKEQVKSLGAKFIETGVSAEGQGGYARELTAAEKAQQQAVLDSRIAVADAVITTASVPGRRAPRIITRTAVERMKAGAVIVDIAAESGGNCELTRAGETVLHNGVKILGPVNLASELSFHASEMYARNLYNFLKPAIDKTGALTIDWQDEVYAQSCLTHDGAIKHEPTRQAVEGT